VIDKKKRLLTDGKVHLARDRRNQISLFEFGDQTMI